MPAPAYPRPTARPADMQSTRASVMLLQSADDSRPPASAGHNPPSSGITAGNSPTAHGNSSVPCADNSVRRYSVVVVYLSCPRYPHTEWQNPVPAELQLPCCRSREAGKRSQSRPRWHRSRSSNTGDPASCWVCCHRGTGSGTFRSAPPECRIAPQPAGWSQTA